MDGGIVDEKNVTLNNSLSFVVVNADPRERAIRPGIDEGHDVGLRHVAREFEFNCVSSVSVWFGCQQSVARVFAHPQLLAPLCVQLGLVEHVDAIRSARSALGLVFAQIHTF